MFFGQTLSFSVVKIFNGCALTEPAVTGSWLTEERSLVMDVKHEVQFVPNFPFNNIVIVADYIPRRNCSGMVPRHTYL